MKNIRKILSIFGIFILLLMFYPNTATRAEVCPEGEHEFVVTLMHKASEEESGERKYICKLCGYTYTEEIEPTGHQWGDWIVDKAPTENEAGHRYRYCRKYTHAAHYQEEAIPPLSDSKNTKKDLPSLAIVEKSRGADRADNISIERERYVADSRNSNPIISDPFFGQSRKIRDADDSKLPSFSEREEKISYEQGPLSSTNKDNDFPGSLLRGKSNGIDLISGVAAAGILLWYILVLAPMCAALRWIKKKKLEAISRMKN